MNAVIVVFFGAGLGGVLRHACNIGAVRLVGDGLPWGTAAINVVGSTVMGLLAGWFAHQSDPGQTWRLFLTTGVLGGFTTFSAFSLDAVLLVERGALIQAMLYVAGSVVLALIGLAAGLWLMRAIS